MERLFRFLREDEIDCRIGTIKDNGLSLLLYKDARCDMNILDETFGAFGWQRHHSRENANCVVSIYDEQKGEWIEKEDTGTESNTEAEKGLASDSFKRACFNWGIGRELYTAPFIWIPSDKCKIEGKKCFDRFKVVEIGYDIFGAINRLVIANITLGADVFTYTRNSESLARSNGSQPTNISTTPQPQSEQPGVSKKSQGTTNKQTVKSLSTSDMVAKLVEHDEKGDFIKCADCSKPMRDQPRKDGSLYRVTDYVAACLKTYGKPICKECRNKRAN